VGASPESECTLANCSVILFSWCGPVDDDVDDVDSKLGGAIETATKEGGKKATKEKWKKAPRERTASNSNEWTDEWTNHQRHRRVHYHYSRKKGRDCGGVDGTV
jgi:hypothetical protein